MSRIIAIDYGLKRTGIATTDPLQIIVSPLTTVETTNLTPYIKDYLTKEKVEKIVIGHSLNLQNQDNPIQKNINLFVENLKKLFPEIPIVFQDERYTSKMAVSAMIAGGFGKKYRQKKENTDRMAAALILQAYIEENK